MQQNKQKFQKSAPRTIKTILLLTVFALGVRTAVAQQEDSVKYYELQGVSVSAPLEGEGVFATSNVGRDAIQKNLGNGSVNNMLELVPAMVTTSDAGTGIGYTYMRIRGIDQTRINVTVNGVALNDAESQGSWFVNLPALGSNVQGLKVQRGVGSSNNGASAFGATMDFTTLEPSDDPYAILSSSAGSFMTFRNSITANTGLIKNRFSAAVAYSNIFSNGYVENSFAKLHSLYFTAKYRILSEKKNKEFGALSFRVLYGNEKTGLAWDGVPSDSLKTNRKYNDCGLYYDDNGILHRYDNETDNYQQTHYQLTYDYPWQVNQNLYHLKITAHLTRGIGYYEQYKDDKKFSKYGLPNIELPNDTLKYTDLITRKYLDNYFYGLNFNFSHSINGRFMWMVGGAANQYNGKHYGTLEWMQYAGQVKKGQHWYDGTGDKLQFNLFGKFIYNSKKGTSVYADVQYRGILYQIDGIDDNLRDIAQNYYWNFFNPKVGIFHSWEDAKNLHHNVSFSFAMANREPTRSDLTDNEPEHRPNPETLFDFELGYQLGHNKVAFSADAYFMYYLDQLILTGEINDVGDNIMTNAPKSFRTGLELAVAYKPVKFFEWHINGTFSLNKILDYTEYVDDWDSGNQRATNLGMTDISFSPNIVAGNEFHFIPVKNFDIALITKFVSKQYLDNSSNDNYIIKPYCINNLHLSYTIETKPISAITLFFDVNNLFNSKYESNGWIYRYIYGGEEFRTDGYFPQAGINFMGGVTLRF